MKKINLIYLLGAGRSGTTAFATILGAHPEIHTAGEMHQFYDHLRDNKPCSCGYRLEECVFWSDLIKNFPENIIQFPDKLQLISDQLEYHASIPKHLLRLHKRKLINEYNSYQTTIFNSIKEKSNKTYTLDSAKYIGRYLSLQQNPTFDIKGIYIVRDLRGVIHSFNKKVQTSRSPISTVFYYTSVNLVAQFTYWRNRKNILKIRYEDLTGDGEKALRKIGDFLELDLQPLVTKITNNDSFEIGHIIGGNRLKQADSIVIKSDNEWKESIPRYKQIVYYFLALPIMLVNRYKL